MEVEAKKSNRGLIAPILATALSVASALTGSARGQAVPDDSPYAQLPRPHAETPKAPPTIVIVVLYHFELTDFIKNSNTITGCKITQTYKSFSVNSASINLSDDPPSAVFNFREGGRVTARLGDVPDLSDPDLSKNKNDPFLGYELESLPERVEELSMECDAARKVWRPAAPPLGKNI